MVIRILVGVVLSINGGPSDGLKVVSRFMRIDHLIYMHASSKRRHLKADELLSFVCLIRVQNSTYSNITSMIINIDAVFGVAVARVGKKDE